MLRTLLLLLLVGIALPAQAQAYRSPELAKAAVDYRRQLIESIPAAKKRPDLIDGLRHLAEANYQDKHYDAAVDGFAHAVANGADDGLVWLDLAQAQFQAGDDNAMASAYNAYRKSTDPVARAAALFVIGRDYDRHDRQKAALAAFEAGLRLNRLPSIAERAAQLQRLVAFRVTKIDVEAEAAEARICLDFNQKIGGRPGTAYGDYVRSEPRLDGIVTARDDELCLDGMKHGAVYRIRILAGLPAATGETLRADFHSRIVVPDRKPQIRFAGAGYVLPKIGTAGLPVTTINVDTVKLRLLRVNDRNLVPSLDADRLSPTFSSWQIEQIIDHAGSLVWHGEMTVKGERNRPVATAIPLKDMLRDKGPGIYLVTAERKGASADETTKPATSLILVSDLGLAAYKGADGMAVTARGLADGKPVAGVEIRLYARNNGELAIAKTAADGVARFAGGLLRGSGGDEPYAVMAYGADHDFNFLEIGRAAFDLSDRGVSGRPQPGPVDAYLYTDRGIYRPGESVRLVALVRDAAAEALRGLPLTLRLLRPDDVEVARRLLKDDRLGGYRQNFALPPDARIGTWRVELRLDPKAPPIGSIDFRVEDFVPPQLKVALSAPDQPIRPGTDFPVAVDAHFYYGAPGADLGIDAEADIAIDDNPYPAFKDYAFGLVDEKFAGDRSEIQAPATGADGKARLQIALKSLPNLTRPLAATIRVGVFEPSGRADYQTLTRPIRQRPLAIGLRSPSGDEIAEGAAATLEAIALDADGRRVAAPALHFELLRETWRYTWYSIGGVWHRRGEVRDRPLEAGTIDVPADKPAQLTRNLPPGRYRWEVSDGKTGAQSSLRFHVGWWVDAEMPDVPDKLEATLDKTAYHPGDTAKLFVKAPFAGTAELVVASDHILSMRAIDLPAAGTTLDIPVGGDWGSGAYALVSAYRPLADPKVRGPARAVGVAWLGIDAAPRTLGITLAPPSVARPRGPVDIPIKVAGLKPGEEAYVTLAAVDEAVLQLTDFASPAPDRYYFGKRVLGVELRDLYGRLIDARADAVGALRSGGDTFAKRSVAGLPDKSSKVAALFSGIVRVAADGTAKIHFNLPDFEGQLRLMAVAWSAHKLGSAVGVLVVRDPVVTTVALPRFLAPGDTAQIGIVVNDLEGAAGDYRLRLMASGAGHFAAPVARTLALHPGGGFAGRFVLTATTAGDVALRLELSGPGGLDIARAFTIGVRPAQGYRLKRFVGQLKPGDSVTLDDSAADAFLPGTGEILLSVSPRPDWDVPGLLRSLDRYAYGCIEQTVSQAMPLLYVQSVAKLWHADPGRATAQVLDRAIEHVAELQRSDGSFGVWNDSDDTVPWLDAYAADFLWRARQHGRNVPGFALRAALGWLHDYVRQGHSAAQDLPAMAYAHYVLARANADDLPDLRYFADTQLAHLSDLGRAQIAAALSQYGDAARAAAAYAAAFQPVRRPPQLRYVDYGSDLRDSAAVLALTASSPAAQPRLTATIDHIAELFADAGRTSTQEKAWLLLAAEAAAKIAGGRMTVAVDNAAPQTRTDPLYLRRALGSGAPPQTIANRGNAPAWRTVSMTGVPAADLPADSNGYKISRSVFKPDGTPADLAKVRQTDLFVVVINGERTAKTRAGQTLVVDLLPAGFEIETATISKERSAADYTWLPKLSDTAYTEERDDRFIAVLDPLAAGRQFTLAYIVRAVTPGTFKYPAVTAEDMYDPETEARTAMAKLSVAPR